MLKKIGFLTAAVAAGALLFGGMASAATQGGHHHHGDRDRPGQVGLANLNNTDVLHNVNGTLGVCGNDVNVLGVQVPIRDSLDGIGVPILSPGENKATGASPYNCAAGSVVDGGSAQRN
ncbi:hypothetical protein [Amycolatopsis circi]|uniref:hypothetical protein n=1 Tax=Amycolatopsis circi TaxID=871959 RepID=UPI000E231F2D|nr:hypothetical protein [Amycolatopsis circi]